MEILRAIDIHDIEALRRLIGYGGDLSISFSTEEPLENPLFRACRTGFFEGVKLLLDRGANIHATGKGNKTALHDTICCDDKDAEHLDIVRLLCDRGANIHATTAEFKSTPLHLATRRGQIKVCKELVDRGANIYARNSRWFMPYQLSFNHVMATETMEYFIDVDPQFIHVSNDEDITAMHVIGKPDVLLSYISKGGKVDAITSRNVTPLNHVCQYDHTNLPIIRILVEHGAYINLGDMDGHTPLYFSWNQENNTDVIRYLLANGASPFMRGANSLALRPDVEPIEHLQRRYKVNVRIHLLMCGKRLERIPYSPLKLLPVDVIRMIHLFLR